MRHIRRTLTSVIAIALITAATESAKAQGWAETWFDNVTYTSPGSFQDQTRGYVTAVGCAIVGARSGPGGWA